MRYYTKYSDDTHSMKRPTIPYNVFLTALCALFLMPLISCKKEIPVEQEPNNTFAAANPLKLDFPIKGMLATRDDIDYYSFDVDLPVILDIQLSPVRGINHAIQIWRGGDTPVLLKLVDDMRKSSPERMCNFYAEGGRYYIAVLHGDRDAPRPNQENYYTLEVKSRNPGEEEREPNDSAASANTLILERDIAGYFSPAYNRLNREGENPQREEDWYMVTIDLPEQRAKLLDVTLSGVPGVNSTLSLFDAALTRIAYADANGAGEGEMLKDVGITAEGRYSIMVASKSFESNNDASYTLTAKIRDYESGGEMEPNNDIDKANLMTGSEISGCIYPQDDVDYYSYKAAAPAQYRIELTPPQTMDAVVTVYRANREKAWEIDNGGAGVREVMPNLPLRGDFFIRIAAKGVFSDGNAAYLLRIEPLAPSDSCEYEPNDTKEHANPLTRPSVTGYTSKKGDRDYYLLEYKKRTSVSISLKGVRDGALRVSITDPLGYILQSRDVRGDSTAVFTDMVDQKGYVIIDAVSENYDEPYTLQVREVK